jgi:Zn-dependent peptidase ImmA (M78 family)/DNA-binding XRE family transcriptional regulator
MKRGTPGFVGARLREGREARGLTAIALSEILGVSRQAVSQYENDQQTPRPDVMERIERVLNLPPEFFSRPVENLPEDRRIFYRSMSTATKAARTRVERRYAWLASIVDYLKRYVSFPPVVFPRFDVPRNPQELSWEDIEVLASETRRFWGMGEGPISNMVWLLENNGAVAARGATGADKLDAFSEWYEWHREQHHTPYVFLGADKSSGPRSRYDAAHELGHLVLHRHINRKHITHQPTFKLIEDQAHRFGSAFLLPASAFANDLAAPSLDAFRALKPTWKVSIAMMVYRSAELELISKEHAQRLWRNRARRGWTHKEPLDDHLPIEKPRLLRRVFELLIEEGVQSRAEIRAALPYAQSDIEELAGLPPGFLKDRPAPISLKAYSRKRRGETREEPAKPADVVDLRTNKDTESG